MKVQRPTGIRPYSNKPQNKPTTTQQVTAKVLDTVDHTLYTYKALPGFLYPSVFGTAAERDLILQTLDSLPLKDVSKVATVTMKDTLGSANLLGVNRPAIGSIAINRTGIGMGNPSNVVDTLTHEVGHSVDYPNKLTSLIFGGHSSSEPFGEAPYISRYAGTQAPEDFAESYAHYKLEPQRLESVAPEKYRALEEIDKNNFMQNLVDRPAFRETGQFIGRVLEVSPFLRWGLEFGAQISTMNLLAGGVGEISQGNVLRGALSAGAGASLAFSQSHPALGPAALGLLGARSGLDLANADNAGTAGKAAAMIGGGVGGAVGGVAGPLGLTYAGHALAGPVGGAIGLLVGAVAGQQLGARVGGEIGLAAGKAVDDLRK